MQDYITPNLYMKISIPLMMEPFIIKSQTLLASLKAVCEGMVRTRFAPSPNGYLHKGHALSALLNHDFAKNNHGQFMLRIEDIDNARSRPKFIQMIIKDMQWLGLWDEKIDDEAIIFQSLRIKSYQKALDQLRSMGLVYPCFCSRKDIARAINKRPVKHGPDGPHYPGTCRNNKPIMHDDKPHCWRLDMQKAMAYLSDKDVLPLKWFDCEHGEQIADPSLLGDVVIWRKDAPASYHLAACCDDAADAISHVIRGMDLFDYTGLHRLLQQLLALPVPQYWHHPLLLDDAGEKLSKSRDSQSLSSLRGAGFRPSDLIDDIIKFSK